ncbi:MAG: TonB-dependent receptor plug domain-containing protein, partial [Bacteroidales bacterium]|nr:TonB-dependent receptor plug domain-containing protein [Bacteroidales bacterium]
MKKIIRPLVVLMIVFFGSGLQAQTTSITILDQDTKQAIPYANLCFESLESKSFTYSISSLDGIAENMAVGRSIVAISFIGYETIFDTISPTDEKVYELASDLFNLNQVVVTATKTKKALKDVPAITQIVTAEEIQSRGITDMATILEDDVPGIEFHQAGFGADIKMQGLDANYVLFLVDGERMAGETEGNIDYNRINMNDIERIEIVKGASSALYGSQAMGGVINIITKRPRDKVEFSIGSKFQQYNEINFTDVKANDDFSTYKKNLDKPNLNVNAVLGFNVKKLMSKTSFVMKSTDAYELMSSDSMRMDIIEYDTTFSKLTGT